jgi:hypothetical protein
MRIETFILVDIDKRRISHKGLIIERGVEKVLTVDFERFQLLRVKSDHE